MVFMRTSKFKCVQMYTEISIGFDPLVFLKKPADCLNKPANQLNKLAKVASVLAAAFTPPFRTMIAHAADSSLIHLYAWPERFLYIGPSAVTSLHRNHAATWLFAHEGLVRVTLASGETLEEEVVFVPSETEFSTSRASDMIAALYWEPESASFARIAAQMDVTQVRAFKCKHTDRSGLQRLADASTTLAQAEALLGEVFGITALGGSQSAVRDPRIIEALTFLREAPQDYDSIESLAERVHLSSSRFAHLFKEEVGVPVRRYVLWQKMRRSLDLALAGDSLTTAALSAGFADSAHLSRTVRSLLGVAPEFLFRRRERLVVHA